MGPQGGRILLLDDRSALTHALARRMRAAGHVVHTLPSPPSGKPLVVLNPPDSPESSDQAPAVFESLEDPSVRVSTDVSAG